MRCELVGSWERLVMPCRQPTWDEPRTYRIRWDNSNQASWKQFPYILMPCRCKYYNKCYYHSQQLAYKLGIWCSAHAALHPRPPQFVMCQVVEALGSSSADLWMSLNPSSWKPRPQSYSKCPRFPLPPTLHCAWLQCRKHCARSSLLPNRFFDPFQSSSSCIPPCWSRWYISCFHGVGH